MYDIFLNEGCRSRPDLSELADTLPVLRSETFVTHILSRSPGFLGLSLEKEQVFQLSKILRGAGAIGNYLPVAYRTPMFSKEAALDIGERERAKLREEHPELTFYPARAERFATELWWSVSIACKEWLDDGVLPGGIILWVDKLDGHLWEDSEVDEFFRDQPLTRT